MIDKVRAIFVRETTIRSILFTLSAVSIAAVLIMLAVASVFGLGISTSSVPYPDHTAGVDISESVDDQSSNITATVTWTAEGESESVTVVTVKNKSTVDDKSTLQKISESVSQPFAEDEARPQKTLNKIGQSVSISGLSPGDKLKIIGTDEEEESGVVEVHTIG